MLQQNTVDGTVFGSGSGRVCNAYSVHKKLEQLHFRVLETGRDENESEIKFSSATLQKFCPQISEQKLGAWDGV